MIKKLSEYEITSRDGEFINVECNTKIINTLVQKINELVDVVNKLQEHEEQHLDLLTELNEMRLRQNKKTTDLYAEQRKWIGKLCRFRDKDYKDDQWDYGLLQAVERPETVHIWKTGSFKHNLGHWYNYCELVKPDDDVIYKGE